MNAGRPYSHTVRREEASSHASVLELLAGKYPHTSREAWLDHIAQGRVAVDGVAADAAAPVCMGMRIVYTRPPWVEPACDVAGLKVLHDDGALLVLHKPSGVPVLPSELYYENTVLMVLQRKRGPASSDEVPHPVHRLGVGTSGLLLCAIGGKARSALSRAFEARNISKTYRALASGIIEAAQPAPPQPPPQPPPQDGGNIHSVNESSRRCKRGREEEAPQAGEAERDAAVASCSCGQNADRSAVEFEAQGEPTFDIACPIGPVPHCSWGGSVHGALPQGGPGAKDALSIVRVLRRDRSRNCTLVEVQIPTGRPHQIRIHMAYLGHPLVGDPLYAVGGIPKIPPTHLEERGAEGEGQSSESRPPLPRDLGYLLHAYRATLPHPVSGARVTFCAQPPRELCVDTDHFQSAT